MKNILSFLMIVLVLASCGNPGAVSGKEKKVLPLLSVETVSPESIRKRIMEDLDYKKAFKAWPDYQGLHEGFSVHGTYHALYINDLLRDALPVQDGKAPDGSIIIKETYNDDKEIQDLYIMAKIKGFDPKHNDWYWAKMKPDGSRLQGGSLNRCIDCHLGAQDNDFAFLKKFNGEE